MPVELIELADGEMAGKEVALRSEREEEAAGSKWKILIESEKG